jgi:hypothetical protein
MNQTRAKKPISPAELWFCGGLLGVVALMFAVFGYLEQAPKFERLRRDGLTVNAEVLRKINFTKSCEPTRKGIARTCRTREFHLRYLIASVNDVTWQYASVDVSQTVFDATREGQQVPVVYLREGPNEVRLVTDVQNYSPIWYALLGVIGGLTVFFCTIKAVLAMRQTQKGKSYA